MTSSIKHPVSALIATAALMALTGACTSSTTGADGNLKFSYYSTADTKNFNKPIAVGAKLDIKVEDAGATDMNDTIVNSASSDDEAVLKANKAGGDTITLEAVSAGSAEISVEATVERTGEIEADRFTMRTVVPEVVKLTHLCDTASTSATYLVKQKEIFLGFDMSMKDGQAVIGYGYYPVSAMPVAGASVLTDAKNHDFVRMQTGDVVGDVVVSSDVGEGSWTLKLVEESAIDGAIIEDKGSVGVGDGETYNILPSVMGAKVCQAKVAFTLATSTPDVCEVKALDAEALELTQAITKKNGWIEVKGKAVGDCKFTVSYPTANAGAGLDVELQVSVENKAS